MKMSALLIASLVVVGGSAVFALGPRILIYPTAWAVVGLVFVAWNAVLGSSKSASQDDADVVSQNTAQTASVDRDEPQATATSRRAASA